MTQQQGWLAGFYALIAVVALIATWSQNLTYFAGEGALAGGPGLVFLQDTRVNPASRSITVDLGLLLLASVAFMVIEARRLGVRFVWLYILFGFMVAISVTFPLFMIARELRVERERKDGTFAQARKLFAVAADNARAILGRWSIGAVI